MLETSKEEYRNREVGEERKRLEEYIREEERNKGAFL